VEAEHVLNRLWIGQAEKSDSGNYSCTIPGYEKTNFPRARVRVHVMDGKLSLVTVECGDFQLGNFKGWCFFRGILIFHSLQCVKFKVQVF
jgi:hypothetical protein